MGATDNVHLKADFSLLGWCPLSQAAIQSYAVAER